MLAAVGGDRVEARASKLRALRRFLGIHAAVGATAWALREPGTASVVIAAAMAMAGAVTVWRRAGTAASALLLAAQMVVRFPETANHELLGLACLVILALIDEQHEEESALGEQALRWLIPIVFVWSGIQKLTSGCWLQGEFLALNMLRQERFMWIRLVVPRAELAALRALDPRSVGSGPFRFESAIPLAFANAVWVLEIVLPALLFVRRTRTAAAWGLIALLVSIELLAREVLFGGLALCLLALFLERDHRCVRSAAVIAAAIYVGWLAVMLA